jgi:hypothetical protein
VNFYRYPYLKSAEKPAKAAFPQANEKVLVKKFYRGETERLLL